MSAAVIPDRSKKERSAATAQAPPEHESELQSSAGAPAGLPLFLRGPLAINDPDDEHEREAERVASAIAPASPREDRPGDGRSVADDAQSSADSHALPSSVRDHVERDLGAELGDVRVRTGDTAARAAESLGARAFAHGRDIWLGRGESVRDLRLVAHEATHIVQQARGRASISNARNVTHLAPLFGTPRGTGTPLFIQRLPLPGATLPRARASTFRPPTTDAVPAVPTPPVFADGSASRLPPVAGRHPALGGTSSSTEASTTLGAVALDAATTAAENVGALAGRVIDTVAGGARDSRASTATTPRGTTAARPRRGEAESGDESTEATTLPPEVEVATDEPLSAPSLDLLPLDAEWPLHAELSDASLPKPDERSPAARRAEGDATADDADRKASQREAEVSVRETRNASALARRAYADVATHARDEQAAFVARATSLMRDMVRRYDSAAGRIVADLASDQQAADAAADRATSSLEAIASIALVQLETSSALTAAAIEQSGRRAYRLIDVGERRSAGEITAVVEGLVAGHLAAFNASIASTRALATAALVTMNAWRDTRADNYPTDTDDYLEGAKNESRQGRIPRWVDSEATRMNRRVEDRTEAWQTSSDTTLCSLRCSFSGELTQTNAAMATEGRSAVSNALRQARRTLAEQTESGRVALAGMRAAYLRNIATQRHAEKSRLASQARAALFGLRAEAQAAVTGVQSAARGALPSFWRAAQGLEQSFESVAPKGAVPVADTATRAPSAVLDGVRRTRASLDERLNGNRDRFEQSVDERVAAQRAAVATDLLQHDATLDGQLSQANLQFDQSVGNFVDAFGQLAGTVTAAAQNWTLPLSRRMSAVITAKQQQARAQLTSLLTGVPVPVPESPSPAAGADTAPPAADTCGHCETDAAAASSDGGAPAPAPAPGGGEPPGPQGLTAQTDAELEYLTAHLSLADFFAQQLEDTGAQTEQQLRERAQHVVRAASGGFLGTVDEEDVIAALRGLTAPKGRALAFSVYPDHTGGRSLYVDLERFLDYGSDDYDAAMAYLRGDAVAGARIELADSLGTFNDDEARIEAVMRALSPDQLAELGRDQNAMNEVRDALDGTDVEVFDALAQGHYAVADAYRMRDAIDEARADDDADATHRAIEQYTGAPSEGDWRSTQDMTAEDRRTEAVAALGGLVRDEDIADPTNPGAAVPRDPEARAIAYVTRAVPVVIDRGDTMVVEMHRLDGANGDLAAALMRHGGSSVEARAARIGVELQRGGDPDILNLDRATFDDRFTPLPPNATPEQREAHQRDVEEASRDRARVLMLAAQTYAGGDEAVDDTALPTDPHDPTAAMHEDHVVAARRRLVDRFAQRFGDDHLSQEVAEGLLTEARPSPATAARAMSLAMRGCGTNEEMLFRFTERMNRDEIAQMRIEYANQNDGASLDADLGTFGEGGTFTEVSGDDRLRMERALMGAARTDQERLENAAFALQQQRREAGGFGSFLADDTLADQVMTNTERQIELLAGGPVAMTRRGELLATLPNFNPATGEYLGEDRDSFLATTSIAQTVAEDYARRIDAFADIFTTGIAVLGAVAAAVIIVATGGAATPLVAAAIITGLASMSANYVIKGGRYGWEQAGIDLGMTAIQAITAGVGAQLGAAAQVAAKGAQAATQAAEALSTLSRIFTGNQIVDQIIIGAITGSISGVGQAALDERTWDSKDPLGGLFDGLIRGALSGASTAALTQSIEALGRNGLAISREAQAIAARGGIGNTIAGTALRGVGRVGQFIGSGMQAASGNTFASSARAFAQRGVTRAVISGVSTMAGRGTEILYNVEHGIFHGDAGDALVEMGHAGLQAALQGLAEGGAESVGQRSFNQRMHDAAAAINRTREEMGLPKLSGQALERAAEDLHFLDMHGRLAGEPYGGVVNLDSIATHGGMVPTRAVMYPEPAVVQQMREELLRHVPSDVRAELGDVPIRVMREDEFRNFTRSEAGNVVTIIENGHPVVVIREGANLAHLADEGPHLLQARHPETAPRAQRLDEATLANWDNLDLDTQLGLYQTKISLEIEAHEHIAASLQRELARADTPEAMMRIAADMERNEATLRNLRARSDEVASITPERRAAMASGREEPPQYLDQPPRLFSKEDTGELTAMEQAVLDAPDAERTRFDEIIARRNRGQGFNNEMEGRYRFNEVYVENPDQPGKYLRVDSYTMGDEIVIDPRRVFGPEIHERFSSQLSESPVNDVIAKMNKVVDFYADARIAHVGSNAELLEANAHTFGAQLGERLQGNPVLIVPEQRTPVPHEILLHAERVRIILRDASGVEYNIAHPEGDRRVARASTRQADEHAAAMHDALLRRVPPEHHAELADTMVVVLRPDHYYELTRSMSGPVATIIVRGEPIVVIREGTPISRLAEEGPHLVQANDPARRGQVGRLDEATMDRWDSLSLDEQLALYRTKLELEIEAHQMIDRSLEADFHAGAGDPRRILGLADRNEQTLNNLRQRLAEVDAISPRERAAMAGGRMERPEYLDQPPRLFSKDAPPDRSYRDQPDVRGPRRAEFADTPEGRRDQLRQRHEDWIEGMRRGNLGAGSIPLTDGEPPRPARYPWHADVESAYAAYDFEVRRWNGQREAGIYRNADTNEYMVVVGDATSVRMPTEAARQEPVLHYHPDYGPSLYRGPSRSDLNITAMVARMAGRSVTEFIEFDVPGAGRARTAFTVAPPVADPSVPGGVRTQIDLEFVNATTGEYTHQRFRSWAEWEAYYHAPTTALDPDSAAYWDVMRALGASDAQVRERAAVHRADGEPAPDDPPFLGRRARSGNRAIGDDDTTPPSLRQRAEPLREAQAQQRLLDERIAAAVARQRALEAEREQWRSRGAASEREADIDRRLARMRDAELRMRGERDAVAARVHDELRAILPAVAEHLTRDLGALIAAIREFETDQGRRLDGKELIEALRNRMRKGPFADLEGLICTATLEENVIAVQDMRDRIRDLAPDAVLAVERGGAFLAEVLSHGASDFPETLSVPKSVTPREGEEDLVQRTPHLLAEIRRRILELRQRRFVIVDFLMGGHFAEELQAMAELLHAEFPDEGIQLHAMWMRESEGYDQFATPAPSADVRTPRPTVAQLELGASFIGGVTVFTATDPEGNVRRYLRFTRESETVTLPAIRSSDADRQRIAHEQFPVGVVLGDDMNTIFDPDSRQPLVLFDTDGHIVQIIPVGTPDPVTGAPLETTRDILVRLMQGVVFPNDSAVTSVP